MKVKQDDVQSIIRSKYGNNAVAIGSNEDDGILTIFWLYNNETEEDYKVYTTSF